MPPSNICFFLGREGSKSTIGFVTFASAEDCKAALKLPPLTLGQHTLKLKLAPNKKVIKAIKKDAAEEEPAAKADAAAAPKHGGKGRKARLVVRNLSFKATEKSMQGHFAKERIIQSYLSFLIFLSQGIFSLLYISFSRQYYFRL